MPGARLSGILFALVLEGALTAQSLDHYSVSDSAAQSAKPTNPISQAPPGSELDSLSGQVGRLDRLKSEIELYESAKPFYEFNEALENSKFNRAWETFWGLASSGQEAAESRVTEIHGKKDALAVQNGEKPVIKYENRPEEAHPDWQKGDDLDLLRQSIVYDARKAGLSLDALTHAGPEIGRPGARNSEDEFLSNLTRQAGTKKTVTEERIKSLLNRQPILDGLPPTRIDPPKIESPLQTKTNQGSTVRSVQANDTNRGLSVNNTGVPSRIVVPPSEKPPGTPPPSGPQVIPPVFVVPPDNISVNPPIVEPPAITPPAVVTAPDKPQVAPLPVTPSDNQPPVTPSPDNPPVTVPPSDRTPVPLQPRDPAMIPQTNSTAPNGWCNGDLALCESWHDQGDRAFDNPSGDSAALAAARQQFYDQNPQLKPFRDTAAWMSPATEVDAAINQGLQAPGLENTSIPSSGSPSQEANQLTTGGTDSRLRPDQSVPPIDSSGAGNLDPTLGTSPVDTSDAQQMLLAAKQSHDRLLSEQQQLISQSADYQNQNQSVLQETQQALDHGERSAQAVSDREFAKKVAQDMAQQDAQPNGLSAEQFLQHLNGLLSTLSQTVPQQSNRSASRSQPFRSQPSGASAAAPKGWCTNPAAIAANNSWIANFNSGNFGGAAASIRDSRGNYIPWFVPCEEAAAANLLKSLANSGITKNSNAQAPPANNNNGLTCGYVGRPFECWAPQFPQY